VNQVTVVWEIRARTVQKLAENRVRCQAVPPEIALTEEGYEKAIEDFEPKQKN